MFQCFYWYNEKQRKAWLKSIDEGVVYKAWESRCFPSSHTRLWLPIWLLVWLEPARGCTEAGDIDLQGPQHLFLRLSAADLSLPSFILSEARVLSSLSPLPTGTRCQMSGRDLMDLFVMWYWWPESSPASRRLAHLECRLGGPVWSFKICDWLSDTGIRSF